MWIYIATTGLQEGTKLHHVNGLRTQKKIGSCFCSSPGQVVSLECCSHSRTDRSKVHGIASHAAQLLADGSSKLEGATFLATSKLAAKYHLDASKLAASEMLSGRQLAGGQAGDYYRVHA